MDAVLDDSWQLRRGEGDDRHPNRHRLDHGEGQAGVAHRAEEEAVGGHPAMEIAVRNIAETVERFGAHPRRVQRHRLPCPQEEVVTSETGAALQTVRDRDASPEVAPVARRRIDGDAVLDGHGRDRAVVPHEPVVVGDVDEQNRRIGEGMPCCRGLRLRRVVLQVDRRQVPLVRAEDVVRVLAQIARRLVDDEIEIEVADTPGRHLVDVIGEVERGAPAAVPLGPAWFDRQVPIVIQPRQRVEVAAVDMPDQNVQPAHSDSGASRDSAATDRVSTEASTWRAAWSTGATGSAASAAAGSA